MGDTLETYYYDLNAVASELLDEKKQDVSLAELPNAWDNNLDLERFCQYCMHDSYLTYMMGTENQGGNDDVSKGIETYFL